MICIYNHDMISYDIVSPVYDKIYQVNLWNAKPVRSKIDLWNN